MPPATIKPFSAPVFLQDKNPCKPTSHSLCPGTAGRGQLSAFPCSKFSRSLLKFQNSRERHSCTNFDLNGLFKIPHAGASREAVSARGPSRLVTPHAQTRLLAIRCLALLRTLNGWAGSGGFFLRASPTIHSNFKLLTPQVVISRALPGGVTWYN